MQLQHQLTQKWHREMANCTSFVRINGSPDLDSPLLELEQFLMISNHLKILLTAFQFRYTRWNSEYNHFEI